MSKPAESPDRKRKQDGQVHSKRKRRRQSSDQTQEDRADGKPSLDLDHTVASVKEAEDGNTSWTVSSPIGGKFIDREPIFSQDEKLLIFATEYSVNTYSTSTSLLTQSFYAEVRGSITDYALSSLNPNVLWVSTIEGHLIQWDLKNGQELGSWLHRPLIQNLKAVSDVGAKQETLFTIDANADGWSVTAHSVGGKGGPSSRQETTIFKSPKPLSSLKVLGAGNIVAVTTLDSIMIGTAPVYSTASPPDRRYSWREVKCKEPPVCLDARLQSMATQSENSKKTKAGSGAKRAMVDVVVGGVKGCIYVYEDLLNRLDHLETPSKITEESPSFAAKTMHWHREAVGSVTWSKNGNYIISGGKETVLVLWQLETGRKQFLPNLESPVQSIVVSPTGSSYAVRLGDNSVMVLSTSELSPTTYVAGLQSTSFSTFKTPEPRIMTVEGASQLEMKLSLNRVAAVINPRVPSHMLAAVPAYQTARGANTGHSSASYIQDFDLFTGRHEGRQAVARTNAISSNLGPEGNRILEPEVKFIQINRDGNWLATIDEWTVPAQDVKKFSAPYDSNNDVTESRLRFWSWDSSSKTWAMNTRIDNPHNDEEELVSQSVLGLVSNPKSTKFATIGEDSVVRIWTLRSKASRSARKDGKNGAKVATPAGDTSWTLQHHIFLERSMSENPLKSICPTSAILCFSNDASILAAYQFFEHDPSESAVYLIDSNKGVVREIQRNFGPGDDELEGLAFLERYLICVGRTAAIVWNTTTFEIHAYIPLKSTTLRRLTLRGNALKQYRKSHGKKPLPEPLIHLAVNTSTSTFAIAMPESISMDRSSRVAHPLLEYQTRILVFSPANAAKPIFTTVLPRLTSALLPTGDLGMDEDTSMKITGQYKGYVVLDVGAEVRILTPSGYQPKLDLHSAEAAQVTLVHADLAAESDVHDTVAQDDADIPDEEEGDAVAKITKALEAAMIKSNKSRPVVRREQLAEVFDQPSHTKPSIKDLFYGVLHLYTEKPAEPLVIPEQQDTVATDEEAGEDAESASESESDLDSSSDED